MTLDKERIAQYSQAIERLLHDWEDNSRRVTLKALREDRKTCLFLCYVMEGAIQTSLDLANHLIATYGWPRPANYRDTFRVLGKEKWIPPKLAAKMEELAGFRNILVHRYPDLNYAKVLPHVRTSWKTIKEWLRVVGTKTKNRK